MTALAAELVDSDTSRRNLLSLIRLLVLAAIAGAAVASRLFAVIRFESIIHEFDPWRVSGSSCSSSSVGALRVGPADRAGSTSGS